MATLQLTLENPQGKFFIPEVITEADFVKAILFTPKSPILDYKTGNPVRYQKFLNYLGIKALDGQWERPEIDD